MRTLWSGTQWLRVHTSVRCSPQYYNGATFTHHKIQISDHISRDAISRHEAAGLHGGPPPYNPLLQRPPHMFEI